MSGGRPEWHVVKRDYGKISGVRGRSFNGPFYEQAEQARAAYVKEQEAKGNLK